MKKIMDDICTRETSRINYNSHHGLLIVDDNYETGIVPFGNDIRQSGWVILSCMDVRANGLSLPSQGAVDPAYVVYRQPA